MYAPSLIYVDASIKAKSLVKPFRVLLLSHRRAALVDFQAKKNFARLSFGKYSQNSRLSPSLSLSVLTSLALRAALARTGNSAKFKASIVLFTFKCKPPYFSAV